MTEVRASPLPALLAAIGASTLLSCAGPGAPGGGPVGRSAATAATASAGGDAREIGVANGRPGSLHPAFAYPGGLHKAYVISMDDGNDIDRVMTHILNRYGLTATFHLNSGFFGEPVTWFNEQYGARLQYVTEEEIPALYEGHEVSSHTVSHPNLTGMGLEDVLDQVATDKDRLEEITGRPVFGLAYPFGATGESGIEAARRVGHIYGRLAGSNGETAPPTDPYLWTPTANPPGALPATLEYLDTEPDALTVFLFMGHSYEYVIPGAAIDWGTFEALCRAVSEAEDVWQVTMAEYIRYWNAVRAADASIVDGHGVNDSGVTIWVSTATGLAPVPPSAAFTL